MDRGDADDKNGESGAAGGRELYTRCGALVHNIAAETKQRGRAAAGSSGFFAADFFDQTATFDQTAEVLLVQGMACNRFDRFLQLKQSEFCGHPLKHHRAVFQLDALSYHGS